MTRPVLPSKHANPNIRQFESGPIPPVKYQVLNCQGKDVLVGRMKIPTPTETGHAFILRRFDTGAVSLTTMFRAAFPLASDQDEKRETNWVKENYNLVGFNGSSKDPSVIRLAGIWVGPATAVELGTAYQLSKIMEAVVSAEPDPMATYRRSGKSVSGTLSIVSPAKTLPSPSPTSGMPTPAKKRRESTPPPVVEVPSPASTPLRRSARAKSPVSKPPSVRITRKPTSKARKEKLVTPEGSDETAVEEGEADSIAGEDLHAEDLVEQRAMIASLKLQRETMKREGESGVRLKRGRGVGEALQFEPKEPEVGERAIATNRRVRLEPETKSMVWGVAAFAVGLSAVAFMPNFF